MPDQWRNVSAHVQPLASGRLVAAGELCEPNLDDPHDKTLITDGALIAAETSTDYAAMKHDQLEAYADGAGLDVKGTGQGGTVTNADLVKALTAHDKKDVR